MAIVRLRTERDRKVNELLKAFRLPHIEYPNGYQSKPRHEPVGGSVAMDPTEATRLKAVNELLRLTRRMIS